MIEYIFLALLNGIFVGTSRTLNGRLSMDIGPLRVSLWNHIIGFIFLTLILFSINGLIFNTLSHHIPIYAFVGGFFGSLFVVVNSYVFPRMGGTKTILLVISGQMIASVFIDYKSGAELSTLIQLFGIVLILIGIYIAKKSNA